MGNGESSDCPHLIADDNGNCVDCGKPIDNPEFHTSEFPNWNKNKFMDTYCLPDLGNIPAICQLADDTWKTYDARATANETPGYPQMPRMQLVDGRWMRIPFQQIWQEVVGGAFDHAKQLGFLGDWASWQRLVKDCNREPPRHKLEPVH